MVTTGVTASLDTTSPTGTPHCRDGLGTFSRHLSTLSLHLGTHLTLIRNGPCFIFRRTFSCFRSTCKLGRTNMFDITTRIRPNTRRITTVHAHLRAINGAYMFDRPPLHPHLTRALITNLPIGLTRLSTLNNCAPTATRNCRRILRGLNGSLTKYLRSLWGTKMYNSPDTNGPDTCGHECYST